MDDKLISIFKALSNDIRISIIKELYNGPTCVCKINDNIKSSQANISKHLKLLKDIGILESEKVGMFQYYKLKDEKIKDLIKIAETIDK